MADELSDLLARVARLFPPDAPLSLRPSAGPEAWARVAERFPGGHAQRWFAACDGQADALPFYDAHELCTLEEAAAAMRIADEIRAEPEGYWVEPHWLAIASDLGGQHLMIDDRDGRVLSVAHDDDAVAVVAPSPEAWLAQLLRDHEAGVVVYDPTFGLIEKEVVDRVAAHHAEVAARASAPLTTRQRLQLAATIAIVLGLMALLVFWLETHR